MAHYKRGIIVKDGKRYGQYPDGSLYRIYDSDEPFLRLVADAKTGDTYLRIRQATEQGYTDCHVFGVCDLAYPSSALRRSRTIMGGAIGKRHHLQWAAALRVCRVVALKAK